MAPSSAGPAGGVSAKVALQVRERLVAVLRGGAELLDLPACERGEILLRSAQRRESSAARLVRKRDGYLRAP
jgi:hypothetical protein